MDSLSVLSVQVGRRADLVVEGKVLRTAIDKRPVAGSVRLLPGGLEGDQFGHPKVHGTPDQALLLCATTSLETIGARLQLSLPPGRLGENLTVEGGDERTVCVGDVYRFSDDGPLIEVSAPRRPCGILSAHLDRPEAVAVVGAPHRAGWYARVLVPGVVVAPCTLVRVRRGEGGFSVERAAAIRADALDAEGARALCALPALAASWREALRPRFEGGGRDRA